jgi:hypothetical protein
MFLTLLINQCRRIGGPYLYHCLKRAAFTIMYAIFWQSAVPEPAVNG